MRPNTPVKVYVAAPWVRKSDAIAAGQQLEKNGFEVTSRWFHHEGNPSDPTGSTSPLESIQDQARQDIDDVLRADVLVVLNLEKSEGKAVETGLAIGASIPVISVGSRSNIFQTLGVEVQTLEDAIFTIHELYPRISLA